MIQVMPDSNLPFPDIHAPAREPDAGSPLLAKIAAALAVILIAVVFTTNLLEEPPAPKPVSAEISPPPVDDPFALGAKLFVKLTNSGLPVAESDKALILGQLDQGAQTTVDRLRAAIAAAAVGGAAEGTKRLDILVDKLSDKDDAIRKDAELIRTIFDGKADALDESAREGLVERHAWFGRLALTLDADKTDPERLRVLGGGGLLVALLVGLVVVLLTAFLGGIAAFVTMVVLNSRGRLRPAFHPPAPGGSVYMELVAVFVGAFLVIPLCAKLIVAAMSPPGDPPPWELTVLLATQWSLVLIVLYPLLRGVSFSDLRRQIGWHSGRGVVSEIGAGIAGYFAGLPLFLIGTGITIVYVLVRAHFQAASGETPTPPKNPVADMLMSASGVQLVLFFTLATLWAPFVEETLFRGALYRHMRARWRALGVAVVTAIGFGAMHGYDPFMLLPVMVLGFTFALMREWRGSLIAPMTAHMLHNGTLLTIALTLISILRD